MPFHKKEIKYPREAYKDECNMTYASAEEYQKQVIKMLKEIFGNEVVKKEWDSVTYDGHTHNHKLVYAPRVDIAVGPFNSYADLDIGNDRTAVMKNHLLVKRLEDKTKIVWNSLSRCFLAIEIVFSGSSKHIAGDFLNATSTGAIGLIVAHRKVYKKVNGVLGYFNRLEDFERVHANGLRNLMVFQDDDFLEFLWELKNPDKVTKLLISDKYNVTVNNLFRSKTLSIHARSIKYSKEFLTQEEITRLLVYGFDVSEGIEGYSIVLSTTEYTHTCSAGIYEIVTLANERVKVMDIIDIAVRGKYRNKGIGTQLLKIFEKIAQENKCHYICAELGNDRPDEPIEAQKRFFKKNGFTIWYDKRAQFSGWVGKKFLALDN
jgi:GNAT superfamily N-acetyltransferase